LEGWGFTIWRSCAGRFKCAGYGSKEPNTYINGSLKAQVFFLQVQPIELSLSGALQFEPWKRLWKAWAPNKCKTFVWLAIRNRCWTADRLQKRGVPHPDHCPLCDQEDETAQHLLTSCVFAQQLWFHILQPLNLTSSVPSRQTLSFADWWRKSARRVQKQHRKGFNSLVILGAWILWKHKNACVFDGFAPSIPTALQALQKRISFEDYRGT